MVVAVSRSYARRKASSLSNAMGSMRERNRLSTGESHCCEFDCKADNSCPRFACYMRGHNHSMRFRARRVSGLRDDDILLAAGLSANKLCDTQAGGGRATIRQPQRSNAGGAAESGSRADPLQHQRDRTMDGDSHSATRA